MEIRKEIEEYINLKENPGALLVSGKWGCGKSFLIKSITNELNKTDAYAISIISLFGIEDSEVLNKKIKEAYLEQASSLLSTVKKVTNKLKRPIKNGTELLTVICPESIPAAAVAKGLSSIGSISDIELIKVKNEIGKDEKKKIFVLIFDDFERSQIDTGVLLGIVNEYSENRKIKTIIVADETKIPQKDSDYKLFKEKVVFRTVVMDTDYKQVISDIVENYDETAAGYSEFLKDNKERILQVFNESETNNLRTVKCIIADFERIYELWKSTQISLMCMSDVFYTFMAEMYINKMGSNENIDKKENQNQRIHTEQTLSAINKADSFESRFMDKGKNNSECETLRQWIITGEWYPELFVEELTNKYGNRKLSAYQKFIWLNIWGLTQKEIDSGWNQAEKRAKAGMLEIDEYYAFLKRAEFLIGKGYKKELDYDGISKGIDKKIQILKAKDDIIEPRVSMYFENRSNEKLIRIFQKLERVEPILKAWGYRKDYISFLQRKTEISKFYFNKKPISVFDDELREIFIKAYSGGNNEFKQACGITLTSLCFDEEIFSDEAEQKESIANLKIVRDTIHSNNLIEDDFITKLLSEEIVLKIDEQIQKLQSKMGASQ